MAIDTPAFSPEDVRFIGEPFLLGSSSAFVVNSVSWQSSAPVLASRAPVGLGISGVNLGLGLLYDVPAAAAQAPLLPGGRQLQSPIHVARQWTYFLDTPEASPSPTGASDGFVGEELPDLPEFALDEMDLDSPMALSNPDQP